MFLCVQRASDKLSIARFRSLLYEVRSVQALTRSRLHAISHPLIPNKLYLLSPYLFAIFDVCVYALTANYFFDFVSLLTYS